MMPNSRDHRPPQRNPPPRRNPLPQPNVGVPFPQPAAQVRVTAVLTLAAILELPTSVYDEPVRVYRR